MVVGALASFLVLYNYLNVYPERSAPSEGLYKTFSIDSNLSMLSLNIKVTKA